MAQNPNPTDNMHQNHKPAETFSGAAVFFVRMMSAVKNKKEVELSLKVEVRYHSQVGF